MIGDIKETSRQKLRELGLDAEDTTAEELYHTLLSLAAKHDNFLRSALGGREIRDANELLPLMKKQAEQMGLPKVWAMKGTTAKRLLKKMPPRKLMNRLGYRSVDSLLKREHISEIFGAIRFTEGQPWLTRFIESYKSLKPSDFEIRQLEIVILNKIKWANLAREYAANMRHNIVNLKEYGSIILLPLPPQKLAGVSLVSFPLLLHYINELRLYSTYLKFNQVKSNFGQLLVQTLLNDNPSNATLNEQPLHWRVLQSHFGSSEQPNAALFEPYIQAEDLLWQRAEDVLYKLEPALMFWRGTDFVGNTYDGKPISFNLLDLAVSHYNQLPFGQHSTQYLRGSLENEILRRYIGLPVYEQQVLDQLDPIRPLVNDDFNIPSNAFEGVI